MKDIIPSGRKSCEWILYIMKYFKIIKRIGLSLVILLILFISGAFLSYPTISVKTEEYEFVESARELQNPKRGFYQIYGFLIEDESRDYMQYIKELYEEDNATMLSLIEINLRNYRDGEITETGLANIGELFHALAGIDKQLIVRFLYDWNGENEKYEPESIETILTHMKQLAPVLDEYSNNIFIIQGLFIGHWGEMHGTKFSSGDDMRRLAAQLNEAVDASVYLSVRTPAQWRSITGLEDGSKENIEGSSLAKRLGLFNDGMLGSESDYGTYKIQKNEEGESTGRTDELVFQEELCRSVPNGGEVIIDNFYNDFEGAIQDMARMHVTYLNNAYDKKVLEKWKNTLVTEEGCFQGMDGLSYMKRHLGYRLLITDVDFGHERFADHMTVRITVKNVGFAPLYREPEVSLSLYSTETGDLQTYGIRSDLCGLAGGNDSERVLDLEFDIDLDRLSKGTYEIYFMLTDPDTNNPILLANEQDMRQYGYLAGTAEVQNGFQSIRRFAKRDGV